MKAAILLVNIGIVFAFFGVYYVSTRDSTMNVVLSLIGLGFIAAGLVRLGYVLVMRSDA